MNHTSVRFACLLSIATLSLIATRSVDAQSVTITDPVLNQNLNAAEIYTVKFDYTLPAHGRARVSATSDDVQDNPMPEEEVLAAADPHPQEGACTIVLPQPGTGQTIKILIAVELLNSAGNSFDPKITHSVIVWSTASGSGGGSG